MNVVVVGSLLAALLAGRGGVTFAQARTGSAGTTLSMDIAITRAVVNAEGQRVGPDTPAIRYRIVRIKTPAGWRTSMTLAGPTGQPADMPLHPLVGGRMEVDEQGRFTMFDRDGREVELPTSMRPQASALTGDWTSWLADGSSDPGKRRRRLEEVRQQYGAEAGRVADLARYVRQSGDTLEELLFDAARAVPMQLNVLQAGALKGQITFEYRNQPDGGVIRRAMRSEMVVNDRGDRAITRTEFSNVSIEEK